MTSADEHSAASPKEKLRSKGVHSAGHSDGESSRAAAREGWFLVFRASLQHLMRHGSALAHDEVKYVERELAKVAMQYRKAAILSASAAGFVVCGIALVLAALVAGLAARMETWLACLLVGALAFLCGSMMYRLASFSVRSHSSQIAGFLSPRYRTGVGNSFHKKQM